MFLMLSSIYLPAMVKRFQDNCVEERDRCRGGSCMYGTVLLSSIKHSWLPSTEMSLLLDIDLLSCLSFEDISQQEHFSRTMHGAIQLT